MDRLLCKHPQIQKPSNQESQQAEFLTLPPAMQDPTTPFHISYKCTTIFYCKPPSGSTKHTEITTYQSKHAISQKT
jgi:hypothetical protein